MSDYKYIYITKKMKKKFIMLFKEYKKENNLKTGKSEYTSHLIDLLERRVGEMEKGEREDIL